MRTAVCSVSGFEKMHAHYNLVAEFTARMQYLQDAASKYLKQQFGGKDGSSESGMDWSNLANLASKFTDADKKTQGELDPDTFKQQ